MRVASARWGRAQPRASQIVAPGQRLRQARRKRPCAGRLQVIVDRLFPPPPIQLRANRRSSISVEGRPMHRRCRGLR